MRQVRVLIGKALGILILLSMAVGCQTAYYKAWEMLGQEKRDLLKSKVESVADKQEDTEEHLKDVLSRLREKYDFKAGKLESLYDQMNGDYQSAVDKQEELKSRIKSLRQIASDLFVEWKSEANQIKNSNYRQDSLRKLSQTKKGFARLSDKLKVSEDRLQRVMVVFKDQVLYLKHNLNAKSLSVFDREFKKIAVEIEQLIATISQSLNATNEYQKGLP